MAELRSDQKSNADSADLDDKNATAIMFLQNFMNQSQPKQKSRCEIAIKKLLSSIYFQIFITLVALYSLFSDDIRMASTFSDADLAFDIVHLVLILIFFIQIVLNWIVSDQYRWSFFFFLDVLSTLSIFLDVSLITQFLYQNNSSNYNVSKIAAQSRASRVATRAVRIVKLVRIIRIVKLYKAATNANQLKQELKRKKLQENKKKLYKKSQQNSENKSMAANKKTKKNIQNNEINLQNNVNQMPENYVCKKQQQQKIFDFDIIDQINKNQSRISKVLSDLTIKKIIIVVLLLMVIVPLFDNSNYIDDADSWDFIIKRIQSLLLTKPELISLQTIIKYINNMMQQHKGQNYLVYFITPFNQLPIFREQIYNRLRVQQVTTSNVKLNIQQIIKIRPGLTLSQSNIDQANGNNIIAGINYKSHVQKSAFFSMGNTIFICIVLIIMLNFFTDDINDLIVEPIQKMMKQVLQMAKNPESVATSTIDNTQYETAIVHNAIIKIGALLSLVFGSAGAQIVGSNIMSEGDMNPMIGGKKKCAIFGFCDIKQFTQVTQLLQEDIMMFVNKIGELVHSSVYRYGGSANKNIGQAFLMIWPLPDNSYKINKETNQISWKNQAYVSIMSDFSIFSFIKAIVKINKDPKVLQYRRDQRLLKGLPNYQVKMGFGLHIGWAIEGAIGSQYKIDASYLSPNVNMASRLQAATKQFGVHILISQDLYKMLTPNLKKFCRHIDRVTVKGSAKPLNIYTIDLKIQNITPPADKAKKYKNQEQMLDVQMKKQLNMEYLQQQKMDQYNAEQFIMNKKQLREVMIDAVSPQFKKRFQLGLQSYINGKWFDARLHLNEALKYKNGDGPTNNILNYMKRFQYLVPQAWKNYRPLTQK